ncbi:MAG: GNAT family N-acetyltransferase [Deltaproteobacteria bacterium]|nr:GNAT family N-acetyltransferase [Deltaproteobacteria bacterium]
MIRKAESSDIEQMVGLLKELFFIEEDFSFDERMQRNGLAMMLGDNEKCCIMVAVSGEQVIGMSSAQLLVSTAEGGMVALIEDIVVTKSYRGQGIGKKLLLSIEKWTNKKGAKRLQLLADKNNFSALGFYDQQNWAITHLICLRKKQERS